MQFQVAYYVDWRDILMKMSVKEPHRFLFHFINRMFLYVFLLHFIDRMFICVFLLHFIKRIFLYVFLLHFINRLFLCVFLLQFIDRMFVCSCFILLIGCFLHIHSLPFKSWSREVSKVFH